ncbi:MAG: PleD family two-component system response regulator [Pirellulaceae bacterium]
MGLALNHSEKKLPTTPWGHLPPRMRVLFITSHQRTGGWLAEAFAGDSASDVQLEEALGIAAGLSKLRDELFDAVLVSHEVGGLDALEVLDAIRAGSSEEQPIVVLGDQSEQEMAALCFEAGGDAYICVHTTTTRALMWVVARAVERHALIAENRRLQQSQRHRLRLEHAEAHRLLEQQRAMIADLAEICRDGEPAVTEERNQTTDTSRGLPPELPPQLTNHYRELLRAYVIMGAGNLSNEMERLAEMLACAALRPQQAMLLHLHVLEEMISGLGSRSARHVMSRADMLILEVMIHLAEQYRTQCLKPAGPPRQLSLPRCDTAPL